jgi:hypothetical protein
MRLSAQRALPGTYACALAMYGVSCLMLLGCTPHRGYSAISPGAHRVEVNKPRLEECAGYGLQRLAHPPVELDLVVQRAEDVGDGALFGERRKW